MKDMMIKEFVQYIYEQTDLLLEKDFTVLYKKTIQILINCKINGESLNSTLIRLKVKNIVNFFELNDRLWITIHDYIITKHLIDRGLVLTKSRIQKYKNDILNGNIHIPDEEYNFLYKMGLEIFNDVHKKHTINILDMIILILIE